jgi:amino-acid N-acetyltransferase
MRTRSAILPDAERIHDLIACYSSDGTLLPRTLAEICENVRDFVVLEDHARVIGCGALHLYGVHLAEIRSITVDRTWQSAGGGERLVKALLAQAAKHKVTCVCLFTRIPEWAGSKMPAGSRESSPLHRNSKFADTDSNLYESCLEDRHAPPR